MLFRSKRILHTLFAYAQSPFVMALERRSCIKARYDPGDSFSSTLLNLTCAQKQQMNQYNRCRVLAASKDRIDGTDDDRVRSSSERSSDEPNSFDVKSDICFSSPSL